MPVVWWRQFKIVCLLMQDIHERYQEALDIGLRVQRLGREMKELMKNQKLMKCGH